MASISLRHVRKSFGPTTLVIPDLSLDIHDRELIVFVGPSGCGKSTLLRCIAGIERLDGGEVWIGERNVTALRPAQRDVAMVFQEYALYPHLTVYENMSFGLRVHETPTEEIDRRVHRIAALLRIEPLLDRKPKALSGGQRQRVAMGRAMVRQPQVFLFDEPLSNLDAKLRAEVRTEIKALARQLDTTMVYVTHDQVEAMTMADRIVVLKEGVIQQVGTPPEIYGQPANQFVAGFIGTPTMNFFAVTLDGDALRLSDGTAFALDRQRAGGLRAQGVTGLTLGLRAEHLLLVPAGSAGLAANAAVVETLGADTFVYFDFDGARRVARVTPDQTPRVGDALVFGAAMRHAQLFDARGEVLVEPNRRQGCLLPST